MKEAKHNHWGAHWAKLSQNESLRYKNIVYKTYFMFQDTFMASCFIKKHKLALI